jgi:hypothetical protein
LRHIFGEVDWREFVGEGVGCGCDRLENLASPSRELGGLAQSVLDVLVAAGNRGSLRPLIRPRTRARMSPEAVFRPSITVAKLRGPGTLPTMSLSSRQGLLTVALV